MVIDGSAQNVGNGDLIGITEAFFRRCRVLAVEVGLKLSFSSDTIIAAALCALLMFSIENEPDGTMRDPSSLVSSCFSEPQSRTFGFCRHSSLILSIAASVV